MEHRTVANARRPLAGVKGFVPVVKLALSKVYKLDRLDLCSETRFNSPRPGVKEFRALPWNRVTVQNLTVSSAQYRDLSICV